MLVNACVCLCAYACLVSTRAPLSLVLPVELKCTGSCLPACLLALFGHVSINNLLPACLTAESILTPAGVHQCLLASLPASRLPQAVCACVPQLKAQPCSVSHLLHTHVFDASDMANTGTARNPLMADMAHAAWNPLMADTALLLVLHVDPRPGRLGDTGAV